MLFPIDITNQHMKKWSITRKTNEAKEVEQKPEFPEQTDKENTCKECICV